jgi:hypothetical protein
VDRVGPRIALDRGVVSSHQQFQKSSPAAWARLSRVAFISGGRPQPREKADATRAVLSVA